jgi:hypothetical protein
MQWWYGHNAVAFFLTTPFLGLMYYFLPKAADRPVFSYKLSILHFWTLVFIYIWAGPAPPALHRAARVGLHAGHAVLRHAVDAVVGRHDQRPADAARRVEQGRRRPGAQVHGGGDHLLRHEHLRGADALGEERELLSHYTDWIIAHVHTGALGWNGFLTFGMIYWLAAPPVPGASPLEEAGGAAFLDRDLRHPALRGGDLLGRHHAGADVARVRRDGSPGVPRLRRDGDEAHADVLGPRGGRHDVHHRHADLRLEHPQDVGGASGHVRGAAGAGRAAAAGA